MPNDARFGMAFGVGLVIVVGVVFFQKDLRASRPEADKSAATVAQAPPALPRGTPRNLVRPGPKSDRRAKSESAATTPVMVPAAP